MAHQLTPDEKIYNDVKPMMEGILAGFLEDEEFHEFCEDRWDMFGIYADADMDSEALIALTDAADVTIERIALLAMSTVVNERLMRMGLEVIRDSS